MAKNNSKSLPKGQFKNSDWGRGSGYFLGSEIFHKNSRRSQISHNIQHQGPPEQQFLKIEKSDIKTAGLLPCAIWKDKIDLKVDYGHQNIYLAPCEKAKRSDVYFFWNRHMKFSYFCRFRSSRYFYS